MAIKETLENLVKEYEQKADKAQRDYWETGTPRYDKMHAKYEDLAEAMRAALNAQDDHEKVSTMRAQISYWATEIDQGKDIKNDVMFYAEMNGLYKRKEAEL